MEQLQEALAVATRGRIRPLQVIFDRGMDQADRGRQPCGDDQAFLFQRRATQAQGRRLQGQERRDGLQCGHRMFAVTRQLAQRRRQLGGSRPAAQRYSSTSCRRSRSGSSPNTTRCRTSAKLCRMSDSIGLAPVIQAACFAVDQQHSGRIGHHAFEPFLNLDRIAHDCDFRIDTRERLRYEGGPRNLFTTPIRYQAGRTTIAPCRSSATRSAVFTPWSKPAVSAVRPSAGPVAICGQPGDRQPRAPSRRGAATARQSAATHRGRHSTAALRRNGDERGARDAGRHRADQDRCALHIVAGAVARGESRFGIALLREFSERNPLTRFKVVVAPSREIVYGVADGRWELGFGPLLRHDVGILRHSDSCFPKRGG